MASASGSAGTSGGGGVGGLLAGYSKESLANEARQVSKHLKKMSQAALQAGGHLFFAPLANANPNGATPAPPAASTGAAAGALLLVPGGGAALPVVPFAQPSPIERKYGAYTADPQVAPQFRKS